MVSILSVVSAENGSFREFLIYIIAADSHCILYAYVCHCLLVGNKFLKGQA